jgi:hypothetical protein
MQRVLRFLSIAAWAVGMISWFPLWQIEGAALRQPSTPSGAYSVPMHVKGVIRYVTPNQKFYDGVAQITFAGGIVIFMIAGTAAERLRRRNSN